MGGWTPCLGSEALAQALVVRGQATHREQGEIWPWGLSEGMGGALEGEKLGYGASPGQLVSVGPTTPLPCFTALPTNRSHPAAQQSRLAPGPRLADLPGTSALNRSWSLTRGGGGCVPPSLW